MKKSLLALAVLGAFAGAASAQSSISLTGLVDVGVKKVSDSDAAATATKTGTTFAHNNAGTSSLFFKGTEDLGNGVKAGFLLEMDINPVASSTTDQGKESSSVFTGTPFNGEQFVSLAGGFGEVKLGTPNAAALTASSTSQPFGTALGSGFSGSFGRLGSSTISGLNQFVAAGGRIIRAERTAVYSTPSFAGVKATLEYSFQNDNNTTAGSTNNNNRYTSVALSYNQGPVNAIVVSAKAAAGANQAAGATIPAATATAANNLGANKTITHNLLGVNFTAGAATLYAGYTTSKDDTELVEKTASWNVAGKFAVSPQVDLLANYLKRDNKLSATAADAKLLGVGVDYKLSKRTTVYARYERLDTDTTTAAAATTGLIKTSAFGVKHTF